MRYAIPATLVAMLGLLSSPSALADTFNIEIDYMVLGGGGGHSHMPQPAEIAAVVQMFACQGHTLNIEVDDAIPHYNVLNRDPSDCNSFFGYSGVANSFGSLKATYKDHGSTWHYCIFAHQYQDTNCNTSTSSGLGELYGDDFVVTLGNFTGGIGTPFDRAATLAHEFGHNLGLDHCGNMYCTNTPSAGNDVGPRPINVPSIMSYFYQLQGVKTNLVCAGLAPSEAALFKDIDYSHGTMCTLDETSLSEPRGTGMLPVDWSCNGAVSGTVSQDLDGNNTNWCTGNGRLQTLTDFDEWAHVANLLVLRSQADLDNAPTIECITFDEVERYRAMRGGGCPQPVLATESCISALMLYLDPTGSTPNGKCVDPYAKVVDAQAAATSGSVLFLAPGTYNETGTVVLNKRIKLFSTGSAVIK